MGRLAAEVTMLRPRIRFDSLRETRPQEYVRRFAFGGAVTVTATLIAQHWGPVVGGMFLAFPGIFPPSISLVERHKIEREREQGKQGTRSARGEASVEAAGASAGALGLAAFAVVLWAGLPAHGLALLLPVGVAAWLITSLLMWWMRERL